MTIRKQTIGTTGVATFSGGTNGLPASLTLDTSGANPVSSSVFQLTAFNTATSITEIVPVNFSLTSATCVDGSGTSISTTLTGGTLTIPAAAVVGGANLTCTFVNARQSAQVRVDKAWFGAIVNDAVSITSTGGTNNPGLVSIANTPNEVDAGAAVTVHAGQTLTFNELFTVGSASNYSTALSCTGASDATPGNGLTIAPADNGATIICTYTNSRIPNATKTAGSVTGPTAAGVYTRPTRSPSSTPAAPPRTGRSPTLLPSLPTSRSRARRGRRRRRAAPLRPVAPPRAPVRSRWHQPVRRSPPAQPTPTTCRSRSVSRRTRQPPPVRALEPGSSTE